MALTYVDASVLIAATKGKSEEAHRALSILDDPSRTFAASEFLRLEVLPKAIFERQRDEKDFYEGFFIRVIQWAITNESLVDAAFKLASEHGLAAMDALHVVAARALGAEEYVTGEKPTKPVFRVRDIKIRSLHA